MHEQLIGARNVFLDAQSRQAFAPRPSRPLPDLAADVLEPILRMPMARADQLLERGFPLFVGPRLPVLASLDPELFSYQVRMNQREGGADELFRFAEAEDFIDFLLVLALDPALGDRVGRNITAFRRELLQRKEQLVPERDLVVGLIARMSTVQAIRERRERLRSQLGEARTDLGAFDALATARLEQLRKEGRPTGGGMRRSCDRRR